MPNDFSTSELVLEALQSYGLKKDCDGRYRCNRPWSAGSDSMALVVSIDGPEHGTYFDHVVGEGGSLYDLSARLGVNTNGKNGKNPATQTKRAYKDLADYAQAHGVRSDVFQVAGWEETRYQNRSALTFPTKTGRRWRFLDGELPRFKSQNGYKRCWYDPGRIIEGAIRSGDPLIICGGEPSVVTAQYFGGPAIALTGGETSVIPEELFSELLNLWEGDFLIAGDCDEKGMIMALGYLDQLINVGREVRAVDLNGGKGFDLADFCALHEFRSMDRLKELPDLRSSQQGDLNIPKCQEESIIRNNNQGKPRYMIRNAAFALQPQPPIEWIVKGLFSAASLVLIVGAPGSLKTYAILCLATCVALGKNWLGFETSSCKVLIVDEESGERRMARRLSMVLRGEFGDENTPIEFVSMTLFDLCDPNEAMLLKVLIEKTSAKLVLIDALADIMPGADENTVKDVHPIFMRLRKIAEETNATIIIIHHSNKAGDYRGSSAMSGAVDLLTMVERKGKSTKITFNTKKARDIEPVTFNANVNFSERRVWMTEAECHDGSLFGKAQKYVLKYLVQKGPSQIGEIKDHADICSSNAARQAVYALADKGYIERVDGGGPGERAIYDLTNQGRQLDVKLL